MAGMVPMTGGMPPTSPAGMAGNSPMGIPMSPGATAMAGYGMLPAGSAVPADMMQAMAAGGLGSPGMPVMGSPMGSPMWNWQGYFQNFYNAGAGMGMQQSPMGIGTAASPATTPHGRSVAPMPTSTRFSFEAEDDSPTAHAAMKGQSFVIGQRSGKWGLPLGLTTVHRHVPLTKIQINHKVREIRQWWFAKEQARKAGKKQTKRLTVVLRPKRGGGAVKEAGSIILSTKPKHFKQWLGPASKTRDYRPSERTTSKTSSGRGKSRKVPKAARGAAGSAAKMLNMIGSRGNSPSKPASAKKAGRKTAAQRAQAAAQAQQAAQLAALVQQQAIAGYGMAPMAAYGMGYPHVAAVTSPPVAPPKQVARRVNLDHARVDQTDSEQDSDDGSELGELSNSGSEEEDQPVYRKKKGRVKKKATRLEKLATKKHFPNAIVLVGSADPTTIRVFETAAKTRNYLGVKNPSTFYDARRNQNVLRGWFIFDGPDYAKKKGAPITYEMISQTDADIKSEVLDKRKKRQEEREKAGVGAVKKATVAPISRSRRATAGKAAAKLGAEGDSENEIENGDENEDDAPPLSDEEPVGRVRKAPARYDDEVEEKPQRLSKRKGGDRVKQEHDQRLFDESESEPEPEPEPEEKPQRRKAPPPRCVCGRYFSSQGALEFHQQECEECVAVPVATPPTKRRKKASPSAHTGGSKQVAANRAAAQAAAQAAAAAAAAAAMGMMDSPGSRDRKPRLDDELNDLPASKRYIPGYGLHKPQIPDSFNFPGLKPVPLRIQTYQSRTRAETQQMAVQSPTSPRSRPILQSLQAPITPPSCPEDVADMSRFPLLRIGDTFEMEFDLASNTNEVGTNFDDQWRLQPAAEHAAFGLTNELTKVTFESYYYDFHNGLVCLRCQEAPVKCNCTYPNDLIDLSTRMSNLVQKSDSSSSGKLKICCKIPRKRDHGRSNSWNSNLRTIHGKSPKVMLLRVIERALQTNMEWKVVSVQQGYCRLIAKNGGLDLAYGEGSAGKSRRSSVGSMSPTSPGPGQRFTFPEGARNPMSPTVMEDDAEREAFGSSPMGSPAAGRSRRPSGSGGYEAGGMHYQLVGKFNHAEDDEKFASKKSGRSNLPSASTAVLKQWLSDHADNPYPTDTQKRALALQLGLTHNQVSYWFINARRRILGKTMMSKSPAADQPGRGKRKSYK